MLLSDVFQRRYKPFFEYCPALSEVFQLEGDKITYHPDLTEQDKKEILDFIDKSHEIKIVKVRRK